MYRLERENESRNADVEQHNYDQGDDNLRLEKEIRYLSGSTSILNIQCLLNSVGSFGYWLRVIEMVLVRV